MHTIHRAAAEDALRRAATMPTCPGKTIAIAEAQVHATLVLADLLAAAYGLTVPAVGLEAAA